MPKDAHLHAISFISSLYPTDAFHKSPFSSHYLTLMIMFECNRCCWCFALVCFSSLLNACTNQHLLCDALHLSVLHLYLLLTFFMIWTMCLSQTQLHRNKNNRSPKLLCYKWLSHTACSVTPWELAKRGLYIRTHLSSATFYNLGLDSSYTRMGGRTVRSGVSTHAIFQRGLRYKGPNLYTALFTFRHFTYLLHIYRISLNYIIFKILFSAWPCRKTCFYLTLCRYNVHLSLRPILVAWYKTSDKLLYGLLAVREIGMVVCAVKIKCLTFLQIDIRPARRRN